MSGSFAELRTGHFHSGLDIKSSKSVSGDTIFAIQNGTVSRLKVEPGGYGNSIYVDHPEGFTSVYAHLDSYHPTLDSIILSHQNRLQQFSVDIRSFNTPITFQKGEFIAIMGNSGRSFGPHLHFEIRETASERLINPILFGIKPKDNRSPSIKYIELKELDSLHLFTDIRALSLKNISTAINSKTYDLGKLSVHPHNSYILSLVMYDQMNGSSNKNGIYSIEWFRNDTLIQEICLDDLEFADSDAIYQLLDLHKKKESNAIQYQLNLSRFHQFSFASTFPAILKQGFDKSKYKYVFSDYEGNRVQVLYELEQVEFPANSQALFKPNHVIQPDRPNLIRNRNFDVVIPVNSTNEMQGILCKEINKDGMPKLIMRPNYVSLSKLIEIKFKHELKGQKVSLITTNNKKEQVLLATCGDLQDCTVLTNQFIDIESTIDTIAPSITMVTNSVISQNDRIAFKIRDNFKVNKKELQLKFQVFINEEWHLFNYDLKNELLSSNKLPAKGNNTISVLVSDSSGNQSCSDFNIEIR